jgi:GAF domain-containing protein
VIAGRSPQERGGAVAGRSPQERAGAIAGRSPEEVELEAQLDRVRLESDTLYAVIAVIAAAPDLGRILERVVEVLTDATGAHACFVYLRAGERLRMAAASRVFAHLVGRIEFGTDEGLAGWTVRNREAAVISEGAMDDPRTNYVPELEEERFQSIVTVPVHARSGDVIGVIVLHTVAPHEFDGSTVNFLVHAASLLAGAIENASLYEGARRRVEHLQRLSRLSQRIAAVDGREQLYAETTAGIRELLGASSARLYELDRRAGRLLCSAADPPSDADEPAAREIDGSREGIAVLLGALGRSRAGDGGGHRLVAPVSAGEDPFAVLVALGSEPFEEDADELLRAIAGQLAVALEKAALIERLTGANIVHDLFAALDRGDVRTVLARAREARLDLGRPLLALSVELGSGGEAGGEELEEALRRVAPGTLCDVGEHLRALLPLGRGTLDATSETLDRLGRERGLVLGASAPATGAEAVRRAVREAGDAARVAHALRPDGGFVAYDELGAYRYLAHVSLEEVPDDRHSRAIDLLVAYDGRRGGALVATLEVYLASGRAVALTARELIVHPNTLRQRLERIETLTGLDLAREDLLSLELALKLVRLRAALARRRAAG